MKDKKCFFIILALSLLIAVFIFSQAKPADSSKTIIDEWSSIKTPAAPQLTEVTIEPKTTALLILDIQSGSCNEESRPRCVPTIAQVKKLLTSARSKKMLVVYSITSTATPKDIVPELTPIANEPIVKSSVDKFYKTDLEKILTDKGIKSVIVTGTVAHGAVLYTATGASIRDFKVIVPVDCMSADTAYAEQYTAWHLLNSPGTKKNSIITKVSLMKF
jgi:nicotinamidase-related amidase